MQKYFKNLITTLIIASFVLTPFFSIYTNAQAQQKQSGGYTTGGGSGGIGGGIGGYLSGLAPAITQLPLCKGKLEGVISGLFRGDKMKKAWETYNKDWLGDDKMSKAEFEKDFKEKNLKKEQKKATNQSESVKTFDEENLKINKESNVIVKKIDKTTTSQEVNETCLKSIGQLVTKMMLQKITLSTVEWINSGFEGGPAFIQNPGEFFGDIAKNEIIQFGLEINNPTLYPFGKAFMRSQAEAFNRKFSDNARYSLNELIQRTTPQYSAETFKKDFSQGGWSAWTYLTSVPANNPIGFQLMASNELQKRLEGTSMSRANEVRGALKEAGGFLGDERCVEPSELLLLTREEDRNAKLANVEVIVSGIPTGYIKGTCLRWEYVTPGKMIAVMATDAIQYPKDGLLKADDLNSAIAAILDALVNRFSTDIMNKGFANFSTEEGRDGSFVLNTSGMLDEGGYNQVEDDFAPSQRNSEWLRNNPNFNIRTDLTQAMIDEQRIYVEKMENYNEALETLIKNIYQLDYCIPGPNPLWKEKAYERLDELAKEIPSTAGGIVDIVKGIFTLLKAITLQLQPIGLGVSINIGQLYEGIISVYGQGLPEEILTRYFYTSALQLMSGLRVAPTNQIGSKGDVINIMEAIINAYDSALKKTFTKDKMPKVANMAKNEYLKIEGYKQMIEDNEEEIFYRKSAITKLAKIKKQVDELRGPSQVLDEDYKMSPTILAEFSRISNDLVDGDDIANIDNLYKQAKDDSNYVYDELLTGEIGCEKNLNSQLTLDTGRRTYPEEIFIPLKGHEYSLSTTTTPICSPPNTLTLGNCVPPDPEIPVCKENEFLNENNKCISFSLPTINNTECNNDDNIECIGMSDSETEQIVEQLANSGGAPVSENTIYKLEPRGENLFLKYGYYKSKRNKPDNVRKEQIIIVPEGILKVDANYPLLSIGPSAKKAAARSLKAQEKICKKAKNRPEGQSKQECMRLAMEENTKLLTDSNRVQKNLDILSRISGKEIWDSIKIFEEMMKIY